MQVICEWGFCSLLEYTDSPEMREGSVSALCPACVAGSSLGDRGSSGNLESLSV